MNREICFVWSFCFLLLFSSLRLASIDSCCGRAKISSASAIAVIAYHFDWIRRMNYYDFFGRLTLSIWHLLMYFCTHSSSEHQNVLRKVKVWVVIVKVEAEKKKLGSRRIYVLNQSHRHQHHRDKIRKKKLNLYCLCLS